MKYSCHEYPINMPGKNRKKFIDKNHDVLHSFKVVSRSQRDPLVADETAPQAVLQSTEDDSHETDKTAYGVYFDDGYDYLQHLRGVREAIDWDDEELEVYTIRKEDPQANKRGFRSKGLMLPSSAFESFVEEPIGLLNKAAPITGPRPELDSDIVAGLEGDPYFEGDVCNPDDSDGLPDDFVLQLTGEAMGINDPLDADDEWEDCSDGEEEVWGNYRFRDEEKVEEALQRMHSVVEVTKAARALSDTDTEEEGEQFNSDFEDESEEDEDQLGDLPNNQFRDEETKSHFTEYSMTSSVLHRNELLTRLDGHFEEKFVREYLDEHMGALDGEDIEGFVDEESPLFQQAMAHTQKELSSGNRDEEEQTRVASWIRDLQRRRETGGVKEEMEEVLIVDSEDPGEKWDCETILSTYSTLYNHPCTIREPSKRKRITVDPRTGMPVGERAGKGLTRKSLKILDDQWEEGEKHGSKPADLETLISCISAVSLRPPNETPDERRMRKGVLRELRRERRVEKKQNKEAFKMEKKKQEKINVNNRIHHKISLV